MAMTPQEGNWPDTAEEALEALEILRRAYVPKNTSDAKFCLAALNMLRREIESGKRTTSAAQARGHGIPDAAASPETGESAAREQRRSAVANGGDAQAASGGCARPCMTDKQIEVAMEWPRGTMKNVEFFDMAYRVRKVADAAFMAGMQVTQEERGEPQHTKGDA